LAEAEIPPGGDLEGVLEPLGHLGLGQGFWPPREIDPSHRLFFAFAGVINVLNSSLYQGRKHCSDSLGALLDCWLLRG